MVHALGTEPCTMNCGNCRNTVTSVVRESMKVGGRLRKQEREQVQDKKRDQDQDQDQE